jgi:hypothetical protein
MHVHISSRESERKTKGSIKLSLNLNDWINYILWNLELVLGVKWEPLSRYHTIPYCCR